MLAFANPADNVNDFTATAAAVARLPLGELEVTTAASPQQHLV